MVIVNCPSCGTRYRHPDVPAGTDLQARCSRCEETFTLRPTAREYVLAGGPASASAGPAGVQAMAGPEAPPAPELSGAGLAIGMDDPTLAEKLRSAGRDRGGGSHGAITYRVDVADEAKAPKREGAVSKRSRARGSEPKRPPMKSDDATTRRGGFFRSLLGTLLLVNLGMVAGWTLSSRLNMEFAPVVLAGSVLGLLLAWWGVRWKTAP